jgi:hypothetical protein
VISIFKAVFQPYAIAILVSLFLAFSNIFVPKYFLDENDFRNFRWFFNVAFIFGPLLLLGVDLAVGFIELKKLIGFIKLYLIFLIFSVTTLAVGEMIGIEIQTKVLYGILFVGAINLVASLLLKVGRVNSYYFLSQVYMKTIPLSSMFLSIYIFGHFNNEFSLLLACLFLAIPIAALIPYLLSTENTPPSFSVLESKVVGLVFGTLAIDMVLRLPYFLSLRGEPAFTNVIDIVTAFTSILLYPAMLYSRKIEVTSKMQASDFYRQIRSGYFSITGMQLLLAIAGACSLWYISGIGLVSYELSQLIRIGSGLAFCATMISVIPNFIKLYILHSLDSYKYSVLWLSTSLLIISSFWIGFINDVLLVTVIFVTMSFIFQYAVAVKWTKSYNIFLNYGSLALSLVFILIFICSNLNDL